MLARTRSFATLHPVGFVLTATIVWLVLLLVFTGVASSVVAKPFAGGGTDTFGRLTATICVLLLIWRLGWLQASGVGRLGNRQVWLIASAGLIYFACASLCSFYGKAGLDLSSLMRSPAARAVVIKHFMVGLAEEVQFRGFVLYGLARIWGSTGRGMIKSVFLASLLFAVLHMMQVPAQGVSLASALLLILETLIISIWWGALALHGGSVWPAVMLHGLVNGLVVGQGLVLSPVGSYVRIYSQLGWFSAPLGALGIALLVRGHRDRTVPKAP